MKTYNINAFNNPMVSYITMENLRLRRELDCDDTSEDQEILTMTPYEFFDELLAWEGISGYTDRILEMINEAFGINLEDYPFADNYEYERESEED